MQYNVSTAKIVVATFFAFCCTGKVCVDSFLAVFLRRMGFSPFQAGILRCLQHFTGGASILAISYFTGVFQKRLSWAVFILVSILSYLLLLIASLHYPCFYTPHPSCKTQLLAGPGNTISSQLVTNPDHGTTNNGSNITFRPKDLHKSTYLPSSFTKEEIYNDNRLINQQQTTFLNGKRTGTKDGIPVRPYVPDVTQQIVYGPRVDEVFPNTAPFTTETTIIDVENQDLVTVSNGEVNLHVFPLSEVETTSKSVQPADIQEHATKYGDSIVTDGSHQEGVVDFGANVANEPVQVSTVGVIVYHEENPSQKNPPPTNENSQNFEKAHDRKKIWRNIVPVVPQKGSFELQKNKLNASFWYRQRYRYPKYRDTEQQATRSGYMNQLIPYYNRQWRRTKKANVFLEKRSNYVEKVKEIGDNRTTYTNEDVTSEWHPDITVRSLLWPSLNLACLFVVIGLLCIAEFTSSPIDKVADESWYQYLDEIDYIERYDQRMSGVSIMTTLTLLGIVVVVKMYCSSELLILPPYHLHIYVFVLFWAIIFFLGYFFPHSMSSFTQSNGLFKGMTFIGYMCRNSSSALVLITVIVCGSLQGCINDYLLWYMEDLGSSEFITTAAVAIAVASEILPWIFSKHTYFFQRASLGCLFCVSIFTYTVRFALLAVLTTPWAIAATQVLHCLSSYFFWMGIQSYVTRLCFQGTSRSVIVILNLIYYYLGRALGSCFSGLVYSLSKPQMLFWCMGGISLLWGMVFFMLQYCSFTFKVPRGRSVLRDYGDADDVQGSSLLGNEDDEDDWLEAAIKVDKQKRVKHSN